MLGKELGGERGQITTMRVLPQDGQGTRIEVSFQATGTVAGVAVQDMGTYIATQRADGTLFGEGQGVLMSADGETATWQGQGLGRFTRPGAVSWRGAIYYQTTSAELAPLAASAVVYEYESDEGGKTESKLWEWK